MFDSITADSVFSDIMMQRSQDTRALLVVEGSEDCRAIDPHLSFDDCVVIIAHGKGNALGAMEIVHAKGMSDIAALVDADNCQVSVDQRIHLDGVFQTTLNDLDAEILLLDGVVDRIGFSHVDGSRLRKALDSGGYADLAEALHVILSPVTEIRYRCALNGVPIGMDGFPIAGAYLRSSKALSPEKIYSAACARIPKDQRNEWSPIVRKWIDEVDIFDRRLIPLHNGHQLVLTLHAFLRMECGYHPKVDNLVSAARSTAGQTEFYSIDCIRDLTAYFAARDIWIWKFGPESVGADAVA